MSDHPTVGGSGSGQCIALHISSPVIAVATGCTTNRGSSRHDGDGRKPVHVVHGG
jgi:hypothetical protein